MTQKTNKNLVDAKMKLDRIKKLKSRSRFRKIWKKHKKVFYIIFIVLFLFFLWLALWQVVFPDKYVLDLSISISNILQLLVIAAAILAPMAVDYLNRLYRGPKININFWGEPICVFNEDKKIFTSKNQKHPQIFKSINYCLLVKNTGKTQLKNL